MTTKTHTFQNAFVCTRPYFTFDKVIAMNNKRMRVHFLSDSFAGAPSADLKVLRISLDAQTRVLELAWWISRLGRSKGIPRSWTRTWYYWTSFERGTLGYMSRLSWRSIGKINPNILSGALQLFRFIVSIVHYGRSTIACSQTLYFLFRDCRVRVWKKTRRGIHWSKAQGVGGGEKRK